ncbi:hypothetical protein DEDE109153_09450 [Deinococcus deserti]
MELNGPYQTARKLDSNTCGVIVEHNNLATGYRLYKEGRFSGTFMGGLTSFQSDVSVKEAE